ncbi:MAG: nuclear transport factor 2 family protein [Bacteroidota bacterium]|nr:nuclear transport factor 2 family protein [Bacteroidota bacterium]
MRTIIFIAGLLIAAACTQQQEFQPVDLEESKAELMAVDSAFSAMSDREGSVAAFHHYIADDGRALPQQGYPRSRDDFARMLQEEGDAPRSTQLTWKPLFADAAASGELGYTHGRYTFARTDESGETTHTYGYYVTIWKRQADQQWRVVLDAGNEAPGEIPPLP